MLTRIVGSYRVTRQPRWASNFIIGPITPEGKLAAYIKLEGVCQEVTHRALFHLESDQGSFDVVVTHDSPDTSTTMVVLHIHKA